MLGLHFILRLICEWRGHDVEEWFISRPVDMRPGALNYVPSLKLLEARERPEFPPSYVLSALLSYPETRSKTLEALGKTMMLRLYPPMIVHRMYCVRCGEAW